MKKSLLVGLISVTATLSLIKFGIWDQPDRRWLIQDLYRRPALSDKLTLAPDYPPISDLNKQYSATIQDASRLESTTVAGVFQPRSTQEIQAILKLAKQQGKKISMSGARHSMGGQIVYPDSLHLDMMKFDQIQYEPKDQSVTVQSGASWKQIQLELSKHNRAVRVMQDSNIFSVGGSLSSNIHGKDPRYGCIIESVISFKLLTADGQERRCSRTQNPDLFRAVIGGMGLFGVITEVTLKTDPNLTYAYRVEHQPADQMIQTMEKYASNPKVGLIEAQMAIDQANFLNEAQIYYFEETEPDPTVVDDVSGENSIWLRKLVYRISRQSDAGKKFRWMMQKSIGPKLDPPKITRNSSMAAPFRTLQLDQPDSTDVLQEYFVPTDQVNTFLERYRALLHKHKMELLNVTVRKTIQDTEALVSYATSDMYAFVSYYKIRKDSIGQTQMTGFTRDMMDLLQSLKGTFYLTYKGYYTPEQIHKMYPGLKQLFRLKAKYDSQELFYNNWYASLK